MEDMVFEFTFYNEESGWETGFADYPVDDEEFYELISGFKQLPSPLEANFGLNVSGNNHSDDLFMFVKKQFSGFEPNTKYQFQFKITFATNTPKGCVGVGGAPGESVFIKAGATVEEPLSKDDTSGYYRMNIDKGNQSNSGVDAVTIGDFANSARCGDTSIYELKTLNSSEHKLVVRTNPDGMLWLLFATDSGYEATTSIYYVSGSVVASKI